MEGLSGRWGGPQLFPLAILAVHPPGLGRLLDGKCGEQELVQFPALISCPPTYWSVASLASWSPFCLLLTNNTGGRKVWLSTVTNHCLGQAEWRGPSPYIFTGLNFAILKDRLQRHPGKTRDLSLSECLVMIFRLSQAAILGYLLLGLCQGKGLYVLFKDLYWILRSSATVIYQDSWVWLQRSHAVMNVNLASLLVKAFPLP